MRRISFLVLSLAVSAMASPAIAAPPKPQPIPTEHKPLLKKWIVKSVKFDGKPSPALFGQKSGDIITIKRADSSPILS